MDRISLLVILIPLLPLLAAIMTPLLGPRLLRGHSHLPAVAAILASFVCSMLLLFEVSARQLATVPGSAESASSTGMAGPQGFEQIVPLWQWLVVESAYDLPTQQGGSAASAATEVIPRDLRIDVVLRADALTAMMLGMVTFISSLVAIFAIGYMRGEPGYWRFFTYIALFVFSMVMLVSVSNFVLLFVFWEAVGVCSYLLIGFWYTKPEAAAAGKKAFLVNRVGDFGFTLALFLIWVTYGTLNYHDTLADGTTDRQAIAAAIQSSTPNGGTGLGGEVVMGVLGPWRIATGAYVGGGIAAAICLLLLLGACGKSAQFPLHVWLPDAMEGPTPVSALIHAATMVTAGVYMITRCSPLFMVSPESQLLVACVGALTAVLAGVIALTQYDLKRVLAYSTVSQLGYMFMGLGAGTLAGITAGMFHLFTHAFFKALLFLGAGSVMHAMGHVIDMRRFGGLRHRLPVTHWTFLVGALALAGFPFLSGFWSKDSIIAEVHERAHELTHEVEHRHEHAEVSSAGDQFAIGVPGADGLVPVTLADAPAASVAAGPLASLSNGQLSSYAAVYQWLYYAAVFTAFLTSFYVFRAYFMTFFGDERIPQEAGDHAHESPPVMYVPLLILAVCAAFVGIWFDQTWNDDTHHFNEFITGTPSLAGGLVALTRVPFEFHFTTASLSGVIACAGILLAFYLYVGEPREIRAVQSMMDLAWVDALFRGGMGASWQQAEWVRDVKAVAERVYLGWLFSLLGGAVVLLLIILSTPLILLRYISPYRLSFQKFYIDEIYNVMIVAPARGAAYLLYLLDEYLVDGLVNAVGRLPVMLGARARSLQFGLMSFYALLMVMIMLAFFAARVMLASG